MGTAIEHETCDSWLLDLRLAEGHQDGGAEVQGSVVHKPHKAYNDGRTVPYFTGKEAKTSRLPMLDGM